MLSCRVHVSHVCQVSAALPILSKLIFSKDEELLGDTCWALSYLSDEQKGENYRIQAVLQAGVTRRLVDLLMHKSNNVKVKRGFAKGAAPLLNPACSSLI